MPRIYERPDSPFFYAEIEISPGDVRRVSTGIQRGQRNRRRAEEAAAERERALREGAGRSNSVSLEFAGGRFLDCTPLKPSTRAHYELMLARVTMDEPALVDITLAWIKAYVAKRRLQTSDIVIRRELTALSSTIEFSIDNELPGAPETNPCRLFRKKVLKDAVQKPRWLQPKQVVNLLNAADPRFWHPFIMLVLDTGMRHEEALGLRWDEVDFERSIINVDWSREKASRGRVVPMTDTVKHTLQKISRWHGVPYVFVNPRTGTRYKSIWSNWRRLRERAGEPTARIHDLRHTFSSWTRQSGMPKDDRKDIVGHVDDRTHGGYAHASIETLVESIRKHSPSTLLAQAQKLYRAVLTNWLL